MKTLYAYALIATAFFPEMAAAQADTPTFIGAHAGVSLGWNQGTDKGVLPAPGRTGAKRSGVAVRGFAGYDLPIGDHVIVGGEFGIASGGRDIVTADGADRSVTDPRLALDATARIGFKPADKVLLYAKGGWGYQRVATDRLIQGSRVRDSRSENGVLFGGGAEFAVTPKIAVRAEYDRVSFNDQYKRDRFLTGLSLRF